MRPSADVTHTIDYSYLKHACPDPGPIHVADDSDEILQVAVDRATHRSDLLAPNRFNLTRLTEFARQHTDAFQRRLCTERVYRMHADETGPAWDRAERKIDVLGDRLRFALGA